MDYKKYIFDESLRGGDFYPLKPFFRAALRAFSPSKQIGLYSTLCVGKDLSIVAPGELGCAESATRLVNVLFPGAINITTSTLSLYQDVIHNPHWKSVSQPKNGCMILAATTQGRDPKTHGHVGFVWNEIVYSNNSLTKVWDKHISVRAFINMFIKQGFPIHYYVIQNV